jgi:pantoate--beta-alanine ligase
VLQVATIAEMQAQSREWQRAGLRVALVPTMGCLHEGHLSLARIAREHADKVVVSIFVNPTQFGPNEDLDAYPRPLAEDLRQCAVEGVDCVLLPTPEEMYPEGSSTWVEETVLSQPLCGINRPTHFRGVTTVVAKLFLAALPDVAVFGRKDAQQALVIERMVRDLNFPVEIITAPIIREADGLAMSSRNRYLTEPQRQAALGIHRGLSEAREAFEAGERDATKLAALVASRIHETGGSVDYAECRRRSDLSLVTGLIDEPAVLAAAAWYGASRLLDNEVFFPNEG